MLSPPGYDALVAGSAVVRRTDRGVVRLRGADRVTWLQGLITNDIVAIQPGNRLYSAYLTPQGRMITDLWVVATADSLLLDVPAPLAASLTSRLDALIFAEDVQLDDVSSEFAVVQVFGATVPDGAAVAFGRDDALGIASYAAYVYAADLPTFMASLSPAPVDVPLDTLDVLRVEAGVPRFLVDMTDETIPLEAGIEDRAISFTKGCYVGQEIIVRVTTRGGGRVARRLVGLVVPGAPALPSPGASLFAGERAIGKITSATISPRLAEVIALGYVHRDFTEPGTSLEVEVNGGRRHVTVHALPFVPVKPQA